MGNYFSLTHEEHTLLTLVQDYDKKYIRYLNKIAENGTEISKVSTKLRSTHKKNIKYYTDNKKLIDLKKQSIRMLSRYLRECPPMSMDEIHNTCKSEFELMKNNILHGFFTEESYRRFKYLMHPRIYGQFFKNINFDFYVEYTDLVNYVYTLTDFDAYFNRKW